MVAPVWWRNHMEVKLIARPKNPLSVTTSQKSGILNRGLHFRSTTIRYKAKTSISPHIWNQNAFMSSTIHIPKHNFFSLLNSANTQYSMATVWSAHYLKVVQFHAVYSFNTSFMYISIFTDGHVEVKMWHN